MQDKQKNRKRQKGKLKTDEGIETMMYASEINRKIERDRKEILRHEGTEIGNYKQGASTETH